MPPAPISKTIFLCGHCGDKKQSSTLFCKACARKTQREAMDRENEEIFKASNLVFRCEYCEKEKQLEALRKVEELKYINL